MNGDGSVYLERSKRPDGTIRLRWVAQLSIGPRESRHKIRRYAPKRDNTRAAAKRLLAELLSERRAVDPRMTLGEYLRLWLPRYERRVGPSQYANARSIVAHHLLPALRDVRLAELRSSSVEVVLAGAGARLRPSTVRHVYNVLAVALDDAVKDDLIPYNPVRRVDRPSVPKARRPPWSLDEVARFLAAAEHDEYGPLFVLAAATGLRQGELLGLAWSDLDLDRGRVTVGLQLQRRGGKYVRVPRKSGGAAYVAYIGPSTVEALRAHKERQAVTPLDGGLVFVTERGRPVSGSVVTHRLQRIAKEAGLRHGDFHGLRRFRSSLASDLAINIEVTKDDLGQSSVTTTEGYVYTNSEQRIAAASLVDAALRRKAG